MPPDARARLGALQRQLSRLYDIGVELDVADFVRSDDEARDAADPDGTRGEALLVRDHPEGAEMALYLEPEALDRLAEGDYGAWCLVLEGVSHFLYVAHRVASGVPVRQLELELQADVDKYATSLLSGNGAGLLRARSEAIRRSLFEGVAFVDAAETEQGQRYRVAHREAARYAASLEQRYLRGPGNRVARLRAMVRELRRFYRTGLEGKLRLTAGS